MSLSRQLDRLAIALSAVCLAHCLAVTLLVAVLPLAAVRFGGDAHFHWLMLWIVLPTSVLGFYLGFRGHGRPEIAGCGLVGLSLLAIAALTGHDNWPEYLEVLVSVAGSLILAGAHWTNFTEVRRLQQQA